MLHITWTIFKFNRNQLGMVSAYVISSLPWSNQCAHQVISEKFLSKEFHCGTKDHKLDKTAAQSSIIFSPIILVSMTDINDEILV